MFNENGQDSKYWSTSAPISESALSYIPENVWNESSLATDYGQAAAESAPETSPLELARPEVCRSQAGNRVFPGSLPMECAIFPTSH